MQNCPNLSPGVIGLYTFKPDSVDAVAKLRLYAPPTQSAHDDVAQRYKLSLKQRQLAHSQPKLPATQFPGQKLPLISPGTALTACGKLGLTKPALEKWCKWSYREFKELTASSSAQPRTL